MMSFNFHLVALTIAGLGIYLKVKQRSKEAEIEALAQKIEAEVAGDDSEILREFNHLEQRLLLRGLDPTSTVTWFEGGPEARQAAIRTIQERLAHVIKANPWLRGKLVEMRQKYYFRYSTKLDDEEILKKAVDFIFRPVQDNAESLVHFDMSLPELEEISLLAGYVLAPRKDFEDFFRISIVPSSKEPNRKFALFFSLSHYAGDGHTFYSLYNMLVAGTPVKRLQDSRVLNAEEEQVQAMGKLEANAFNLPGLILTALRGLFLTQIYGPLVGTTKYQKYSRYILVDNGEISKIKHDEMARQTGNASSTPSECPEQPVAFVSTNDILTSWFIRSTGQKHGIFMMNLRGRIPSHKDNLAGNYENGIYVRSPEDVVSPIMVRRAVNSMKRASTNNCPMTEWEMLRGGLAAVSNWASFMVKQVDLGHPDCKQIIHMPCFDLSFRGGCTFSLGIIFQATAEHTGFLLTGTAEIQKRLENCPFESKSISFPIPSYSGLMKGATLGAGKLLQRLAAIETAEYKETQRKALREAAGGSTSPGIVNAVPPTKNGEFIEDPATTEMHRKTE